MPRDLRIAYIVGLCFYFLYSFLGFQHKIIYQVLLSDTNKLQTSIWSIDGTLTGTTILGQSGPGSN